MIFDKDLLKMGVSSTLYPLPFKKGGKIFIKPENRGKFTAYAESKGMSVQEAARKVLADEDAPASLRKQANFARNAAKWNKKQDGGLVLPPKKTFGSFIRGLFDPVQRTENRYYNTVRRAVMSNFDPKYRATKLRPHQFVTATDFLPDGDITKKPIPKGTTVTVSYKPPKSYIETVGEKPELDVSVNRTLPSVKWKFAPGQKMYVPSFVETGDPSYGKSVLGNYRGEFTSDHPKYGLSNTGLRATLQRANEAQQPVVEWRGKLYKAGKFIDTGEMTQTDIPGESSINITGTLPGIQQKFIPGTLNITQHGKKKQKFIRTTGQICRGDISKCPYPLEDQIRQQKHRKKPTFYKE